MSGAVQEFTLDRFQRDAIAAIDDGHSVLVAAPTGAGKTLVAEHAVEQALGAHAKAFYTTPIKALSNQKYRDLAERHGAERVGLLTGDNSINPDAPIVVMTTEVLRNMVYSSSPLLDGLGWVVLDEVHYLRDRYRGPVWEEVIIHTPMPVTMVCLSATISNVDELADWMRQVRGRVVVVTEHERPVQLDHQFMVHDQMERRTIVVPTLVDGRANPDGSRFDIRDRRGRGSPARRRWSTPRRREVVERLQRDDRLPAIYFIFSRIGCEEAVGALVGTGLELTSPDERREIAEILDHHMDPLDAGDLGVLGHDRWRRGMLRGIGSHHAGMVPPFKEAVEACFIRGLIKVVFATETLALGVNMPARTVVIERLSKFGGETHELLTPLEYTQLTGRAGRRGIDTEGRAVVLWSPFVTFGEVAALASSRSFSLQSAFKPSYNMVANLAATADERAAREILRRSFAQFQIERQSESLNRRLGRTRSEIDGLEEPASCERGDVADYVALLDDEAGSAAAAGRAAIGAVEDAMSRLRPGQVITVDVGPEPEPAAVLSVAYRKGGAITVRAVTGDRLRVRLRAEDFDEPPEPLGTVDLPHPYTPDQAAYQHEVARRLRRARVRRSKRSDRPEPLPSKATAHPVASCPRCAEHVSSFREQQRLIRRAGQLERRIKSAEASLLLQFDAVVSVLRERRAVRGFDRTPKGDLVARVYHESDLLVAEAISAGLLDDLDPMSFAGLVSALIYERRGGDPPRSAEIPTEQLRDRLDQLDDLADVLLELEDDLALDLTRPPDRGFVASAFRWADGRDLATSLDDEMTGGDFVRNIRLLIDLCRQLADLVPEPRTAACARRAVGTLERGVVAISGSLDASV